MRTGFKKFWHWFSSQRSPAGITPRPAEYCCPQCLATQGRALPEKLMHLVREHLDVEERWLLRMLINQYHLNDLCALLGVGPDSVRQRVIALRAKIMVLLNQQKADDCVKRSFHRVISGPWF